MKKSINSILHGVYLTLAQKLQRRRNDRSSMAEISLEGLAFYGYHGFYEEEKKTGNRFSVDVKVNTSLEEKQDLSELSNTIDYQEIYTIVKSEMSIPSVLLENLANNILNKLFVQFSSIDSAEVSISKFNPPIGGVCERAKVTLRRLKSEVLPQTSDI